MISELDLLLIRQREHEIQMLILKQMRASMAKGQASKDLYNHLSWQISDLEEDQANFAKQLEQQGHDYLTITAEMARIRAEVRGEK